jgi:putative transposase
MPHKNTIRHFIEEGIYHVYNRGVEKRDIFLDEQDYAVFLHLLKYYLSPFDLEDSHPLMKFQNFTVVRPRPLINLEKEIDLLAYCLMPNHFHLIIKQHTKDAVTKLLRKVSTTYAMYFNKRYKRVGYLFQGKYKAALVETDYYLLHLSRYVHLNPGSLTGTDPVNYPYSSYKYYLGEKHASWLKTDLILSFFDRSKLLPFLNSYPSYADFVEKYEDSSGKTLGNLTLEKYD